MLEIWRFLPKYWRTPFSLKILDANTHIWGGMDQRWVRHRWMYISRIWLTIVAVNPSEQDHITQLQYPMYSGITLIYHLTSIPILQEINVSRPIEVYFSALILVNLL